MQNNCSTLSRIFLLFILSGLASTEEQNWNLRKLSPIDRITGKAFASAIGVGKLMVSRGGIGMRMVSSKPVAQRAALRLVEKGAGLVLRGDDEDEVLKQLNDVGVGEFF